MFHIKARIARLLRILHLKQDDEATLYTKWWCRLFSLCERDREIMRAHIAQFVHTPLISVVMPVYNPPHRFLVEAIESVRKQIYTNWELCIADDASTDPEIYNILERYAQVDARIHVVFRKENGHISAASNSALELASGEFIALLDHDDLLTEDALFWVVEALQRHPDVLLFYSDEDKINANNKLEGHYFKPNWDPYLFFGENYFSHLGVYQRKLVISVGGFRKGFEGSQDYDLAARCIDCISSKHIVHIPHVLYHWRIHKESTANTIEAKPYARIAAIQALKEHIKRMKISADIRQNNIIDVLQEVVFYDIRHIPLITIIISTKNNYRLLENCISSITNKTNNVDYEIIIVDNNSDDIDTLNYISRLQDNHNITVLRFKEQFNFSKINNLAVKYAKGDIFVLLNDDTEVISPNWLKELAKCVLLPNIGAVGAKLLYPDETIQHAGIVLGMGACAALICQGLPENHPGYYGNIQLLRCYSAVTGACLAVEKQKYLDVCGLDEENFTVGYNDIDFCLKLKEKGYRNLYTPNVLLVHHESASRGSEDTPEKQKRFWNEQSLLKKRWPHVFSHDPAYNPNLTLTAADYGLARIPRTVQNAANWPEPFPPTFVPPKGTGLHLLIVVDTNSRDHAERIAGQLGRLLTNPAIASFAFVGPTKVALASPRAAGWFDAVLVYDAPFKNHAFRENIQPYWPCVVLLPDNAEQQLSQYNQDNILYRSLVHACHVLVQNEAQLDAIHTVSGLRLHQYATCITDPNQPDQAQRIVDVLTQARLKHPLPACCLGLAR